MCSLKDPQPELDLHGLAVDEALVMIDQFLYDAYVARIASVRLVHGKGTGTLRKAIRSWLPKHQLVKSFRWAEPEAGGSGATVVELVD
jgi:DNA mismatch repair protein MutS2